MDPTSFQPSHLRKASGGIKNRTAAPVQITAEQIIVEAQSHVAPEIARPTEHIEDAIELDEYRLRKRKSFEDTILHNRQRLGTYVQYAKWEAQQGDFRRSRSVFERALQVNPREPSLYLQYSDMEMTHGHVQHARNVLDRAVTLLPRVADFWIKFAHMEELLGNVPGARLVFQRWMEWLPDKQAWGAFVAFERRYDEVDRARAVCEDMVAVHADAGSWLKYAAFEVEQGAYDRARAVFERALGALGDTGLTEKFLITFAEFEERLKELDRARVIYRYGLDKLAGSQADKLTRKWIAFEKQHGSREGIEDAIADKRRAQYEEQTRLAPDSYDVWFDYVRMEEETGDIAKIREVYERAIGVVPPEQTQAAWERYVFLWAFYAVFEELTARDVGRARQVHQGVLAIVPHAAVSFPELWIRAAEFEIRQHDIAAARKIFGNAIGRAPTPAVFARYIELEYELLNFDRCRAILTRQVEVTPTAVQPWIRFAAFEEGLGEVERARGLFEVAVELPELELPELLWKSYIDFEIGQGEPARVFALFERLIDRAPHVKVWIAFAKYAASTGDMATARAVFARGDSHAKVHALVNERVMVLEAWRDAEAEYGDQDAIAKVRALQPTKVKRRRKLLADDGTDLGWEEYVDYMFPDVESRQTNLKLLEAAREWAAKRQAAAAAAAAVAEAGSVPAPVAAPPREADEVESAASGDEVAHNADP